MQHFLPDLATADAQCLVLAGRDIQVVWQGVWVDLVTGFVLLLGQRAVYQYSYQLVAVAVDNSSDSVSGGEACRFVLILWFAISCLLIMSPPDQLPVDAYFSILCYSHGQGPVWQMHHPYVLAQHDALHLKCMQPVFNDAAVRCSPKPTSAKHIQNCCT